MSDFVKEGPSGPQLNTSALRSAGKALLNTGSAPAPAAPAAIPASPAAPTESAAPMQSTVTVQEVGSEQPVSTPEAVAPASDPAAPAAAPQVVDLPDDALVRVTVNGKEEIKTWAEARKEHMLHRAYTQNQQKLRAEQAEFEAKRQELMAKAEQADKLSRLVTDPELFARYAVANPEMAATLAARLGVTVAQATAGAGPQAQAAAVQATQPVAGQPAAVDAGELVNYGEVQTLLGQQLGTLEGRIGQTFEQQLEARAQAILGMVDQKVSEKLSILQDAHEVSQFNQAITKTIDETLTANPALTAIPRINELIRFEVAQMMPNTPEEMTEAINIVAKGIVEGLDQTYNQSRSAALIAKERLVTEGIEPPTGTPVNNIVKPQPSMVLPGGKMDWNAMRERAKAALGS